MQLSDNVRDADWAFEKYEAVRDVLPNATFPVQSDVVADLSSLEVRIDTFFLDAFGVLNVGETAIPGAVERMSEFRRSGNRLLVLSNSASYPTPVTAARYRSLGFDFTDDEVVTSRDALKVGLLSHAPILWGVAAMRASEIEELGVKAVLLEDDPAAYRAVEGFILLSAGEWTDARQEVLIDELTRNPRPVLVGNPDIVAPRETTLSLEPGFYAHDVAARTISKPIFYGKPFSNIFELAVDRIGHIDPQQTAMVGDTLHTDIIGGAAAGIQTVLITDHGLFAGKKIDPYINASRISPNVICRTT